MKTIHLTLFVAASISCVTFACVDSAPVANAVNDAGGATDSGPQGDAGQDSSTKDSGTDAAPTWNPSQLAGLSLWLDAQKGVSGTTNVTAWDDQSGKGNDFTQGAAANQPALAVNAVNGLNALQFTANNDTFLEIEPLPTSLNVGTGDFAIALVVEWDNVPANTQQVGYGCLFVPSPTSGLFANDPYVPNASVYAQLGGGGAVASSATTLNDGHYHYVAMRRTGTTLEARADGTGATTTLTGAANLNDSSIGAFIGGRVPAELANQALDGHVAEVVVVNGTLSDPDIGLLETYFKSKFGL